MDTDYLDYVNLSISRVNTDFFGASRRWHRHTDVWWAIVSVDPVILTHEGVIFVTTNNIYPARRRGTGADGLEALFAGKVRGRYEKVVERSADTPANHTTCVQAEVLYPGEIPSRCIRTVYTATDEHADLVATHYDMLVRRDDARDARPELPVHVRPDLFDG